MLAWLAANAVNIIIIAVLVVVVGLLIRGLIRGKLGGCADCGSCGTCGTAADDTGCHACQFAGSCHKEG